MKSARLAILLLFTCIRLHVTHAQNTSQFRGLPFITNYGAATYKAGIQNWDIIEDDQGLLYVANNLGLLEFDGQNWQIGRASCRERV